MAGIPKSVKDHVWNIYIGATKAEGPCYVCGKTIHIRDFHAGHVKARVNGGATTPDNLRPICSTCNASMHDENLEAFKAKHFPNIKGQAKLVGVKTRQLVPTDSTTKCPNCKGKGTLRAWYIDEDPVTCPSCRKKGVVESNRTDWVKCPKCKGYGKIDEGLLGDSRCQKCRGLGIVPPRTNG